MILAVLTKVIAKQMKILKKTGELSTKKILRILAVILFIILHSCKSLYVILVKLARDREEIFEGKFGCFEDEKEIFDKF